MQPSWRGVDVFKKLDITDTETPETNIISPEPSDAFQKREKANEDYAIRQREKEKLLELKKKLAEQQAHLKQLESHMYVTETRTYPRVMTIQTRELTSFPSSAQ